MDFAFTPEQLSFRQEVRDFLDEALTPEEWQAIDDGAEGTYHNRAFSKKLAAKGWIGLSWPKEWGGQAISHMMRLIYYEEMITSKAPIGYHFIAERQMGPSFMLNGTEEQKRQYVPGIVNADISFCIGYSEPGAGSDLAGLQTRAVRDGDDYVVNGSKIWTSGAHMADYIWLATRTDPDAPKHKGISVFVLPLNTPGVEIRPLISMDNDHGFNQIFFDNVRVPKSGMVGEKNQGWYVVAANLDFERSGIERIANNYKTYRRLERFMREEGRPGTGGVDAIARHKLAEMAIDYNVGRLLAYRVAWQQSEGMVPNYEASMSKMYGCEASQRISRHCADILGLYGLFDVPQRRAPMRGRVGKGFLRSVSNTIAGGTTEIQRNIIATRGLGLPR